MSEPEQAAPSGGVGSRPAAPGPLGLVQRFVNTYDVEEDVDDIGTSERLRDWFAESGLMSKRAPVNERDVERAREVREAIRGLLMANHGDALDERDVRTLNRVARDAPLHFRIDEEGDSTLAPLGSGVDAALAELFGIVARASAEGTWKRLKVCRDDTCQWAFYDRSKNRSSTWCSMAVCGNRAKARAYRRRHQGDG